MNILTSYLKQSWYLYRTNLAGICLILFPIMLPLDVINTWIECQPESTALSNEMINTLWVMEMLILPVCQGALLFFLQSVIMQNPQAAGACYRQSLTVYTRLLLLYAIATVAIFFGLLLLIIPGLLLAARLMFSEFHCAYEGQSATDAIRTSIENTSPYQWLLITGILIITLISWGPLYLLGTLFEESPELLWPGTFIINVTATVLSPLITVFGFRVYMDYRQTLTADS